MAESLAVGPSETADLVALGWLRLSDRGDKNAVTRALSELIKRAIRARVTPSTGSEEGKGFFCEIRPSTTLQKLADVVDTSHCGIVTPAQAGVQGTIRSMGPWMPAFASMTR